MTADGKYTRLITSEGRPVYASPYAEEIRMYLQVYKKVLNKKREAM